MQDSRVCRGGQKETLHGLKHWLLSLPQCNLWACSGDRLEVWGGGGARQAGWHTGTPHHQARTCADVMNPPQLWEMPTPLSLLMSTRRCTEENEKGEVVASWAVTHTEESTQWCLLCRHRPAAAGSGNGPCAHGLPPPKQSRRTVGRTNSTAAAAGPPARAPPAAASEAFASTKFMSRSSPLNTWSTAGSRGGGSQFML